MERLTMRSPMDKENALYSPKDEIKIVDKLAEYEDTGLTPKEISSMIAELHTMQKAYESLTEKNERLQKECVDTYTQLMETEREAQEIIAVLREKLSETKSDRDYWKAEAMKHCAKLGEIRILAEGGAAYGC